MPDIRNMSAEEVAQARKRHSRIEDNRVAFTRTELEQALQDSEVQEILHHAGIDLAEEIDQVDRNGDVSYRKLSEIVDFNLADFRTAIIDRLFLWQSVNRSITS